MEKPLSWLLAAALIASLLAVGGCGEQQQPLKIARHLWPGYEFMYLAEALGQVDGNHIEFVQTQTAPDTLELLLSGQVDGGALTLDEVLRAHDRGLPLVAVLVFNISAGADVLLARADIDTLAELRGRKIGVETGAVGAIMLDRALHAAGLSPDQVEVVPLGLDEQVSAWRSERMDAVITYEPNASQIRALGARKLFSSRKAPNLIVDVLAFRPEALQRHESIRHLVDAHFAAQKHFLSNPVDAGYRLAPRLGVPPGQVNSMYNGLLLPQRENNMRLLSGNPPQLQQDASSLVSIMHAADMIQLQRVPHGLVDDRFIGK